MAVLLANNATSTLVASITASDTSLTIQSADAGRFPSPAGGDWFPLTLVDAAGNMEILKVTGRSAGTLTVQRGQEGTSATDFAAGVRADLRLTKAAIEASAPSSFEIGDTLTTARDPGAGWFECDGSTPLITDYPLLAPLLANAFSPSASGTRDWLPVGKSGSGYLSGARSLISAFGQLIFPFSELVSYYFGVLRPDNRIDVVPNPLGVGFRYAYVNSRLFAFGTSARFRELDIGLNVIHEAIVTGVTWEGMAFGNNEYVLVGQNNRVSSAVDPRGTWTARTSPFPSGTTINFVKFAAGVFVMGGSGGQIATSTDGRTWTIRVSGFGSSAINCIGYGRITFSVSGFVIAGNDGKVAYATDPTGTWTLVSTGTANEIVDVTTSGTSTTWFFGGSNLGGTLVLSGDNLANSATRSLLGTSLGPSGLAFHSGAVFGVISAPVDKAYLFGIPGHDPSTRFYVPRVPNGGGLASYIKAA